jgi:hypothetical protein
MTHVIIFLLAAWRLVDHLLKMLVVDDRGVGNVVRNSVHHTMIQKRVNVYRLLRTITANVVKTKKASQRRAIVLAVTIRTVIRDGRYVIIYFYIFLKRTYKNKHK